MNQSDQKYKKWSIFFNPLILIIYAVGSYYLTSLLKYGGIHRRLPVVIITFTLLIIWIVSFYFYTRKQKKKKISKNQPSKILTKLIKYWFYFVIVAIISITSITAYDIYQSSKNLQGKLAWKIEDWKNTTVVDFEHNNIYEYGFHGLLLDIEEKIELPNDLYISNELTTSFKKDGDFTDIYTFLYGKNDEDDIETFLISTDPDNENKLTIRTNGHTEPTFDEGMKFNSLLELTDNLPLEKYIKNWDLDNNEEFETYYIGERTWPQTTEEIVFFDENEILSEFKMTEEEITGHTLSVYPKDDPAITPKRFIYTGIPIQQEKFVPEQEKEPSFDVAEQDFINQEIGYQLVILDAALGSRYYGLTKSVDGGKTWEMFNDEPFGVSSGEATGLFFLDEQIGFTGLSHSGGAEADLYRTEDGGQSFEIIDLPEVEVQMIHTNKMYNPFVYPEIPFEKDGELLLYVNQGAAGDYKGGIKAIYKSEDEGKTWEYVGEDEETS